ncbi:class I SAM-dependent methyltransferase [Sulfitobacter sabulilitoris]|uniref:Class I SAM-dependent methyltransferase n=1 Tax=Sulfitobacter sabulilitoris TaxID=2562655 RepID=A0A5S3PM09_9RHOB|nr:SAM-dependent methyltransferase [Sulfitobacter sabulilitoris]TMM55439.1 class I SAM-dependent methyltransferase [Sulfitobacter sabulilitoris]
MTLRAELVARISAQGPLSVADYMADCLLHPIHGYYTTRDPFGATGDFITAPEISQMFGELIGLSLAQAWIDQGRPTPFTLAEPGPGRGTLMADILRATQAVPGFHEAARLHLIEPSPTLAARQRETLGDTRATWVQGVGDLPHQPLFLVANEFFDALPLRQFVRSGTQWRERQVGVAQGELRFGLGPASPQPALAHRLADTDEGDIVEYAPALAPITAEIGDRIERSGGAALIIDYGDWRSRGDTLQAVMAHETVDPLATPGQADLTAHVDFEALTLATPSAFSRVTPQGVFLERLGITARAQALAKPLTGEALAAHVAAHRRLTHPDEMGTLFKVLGLYPSAAAPPPGLSR